MISLPPQIVERDAGRNSATEASQLLRDLSIVHEVENDWHVS